MVQCKRHSLQSECLLHFMHQWLVFSTPFDEMKVFYQEYKLAKYSNVLMARDIKYFFPSFYKFRSLPFLALFNEKGKLITTFEGSTKMAQVVEAFQPRRMM